MNSNLNPQILRLGTSSRAERVSGSFAFKADTQEALAKELNIDRSLLS